MSKVLITFDTPGMTAEQYDAVHADLVAAGASTPSGRLFHVGAPMDNGWQVVDVWESVAAFEQFGETLTPILQKNGVPLVEPGIFPAHNIMFG